MSFQTHTGGSGNPAIPRYFTAAALLISMALLMTGCPTDPPDPPPDSGTVILEPDAQADSGPPDTAEPRDTLQPEDTAPPQDSAPPSDAPSDGDSASGDTAGDSGSMDTASRDSMSTDSTPTDADGDADVDTL